MRILFFWRIAGVGRSVWLAYLSRQPGAVHWVRHAVRSIEFCQDCQLAGQNANASTHSDGVLAATSSWVENQLAWFVVKERHHFDIYLFWKKVAQLSIGASFAAAAGIGILTILPNGHEGSLWDVWVKPDAYGNLWQLAFGLFAAIELSARDRRMNLDLMKRYASQKQIFEAASRALGDPTAQWSAGKCSKNWARRPCRSRRNGCGSGITTRSRIINEWSVF